MKAIHAGLSLMPVMTGTNEGLRTKTNTGSALPAM